MKLMNIHLALKELGVQPVFFNVLYRLKILSGYYRLVTPPAPYADWNKYFPHGKKEPKFVRSYIGPVTRV